jgi:superfamily II DNA/RNA helicase
MTKQCSFDDFDLLPPLLQTITRLGFQVPTVVQQHVLPIALAGQQDLLVSAMTGSGKTVAFLLPLVQQLWHKQLSSKAIRSLILVPTRELAQQIQQQCHLLITDTPLQVQVITGGVKWTQQCARLQQNPDILIATPGRLLDLLTDHVITLATVDFLILDEADRMLDLGFIDAVLQIVDHCPASRRTWLFSATLHHHRLQKVIGAALQTPKVLTLHSPRHVASGLTHQWLLSDDEVHKQRQVLWFCATKSVGYALIFVNKKQRATALYTLLYQHGVRCGVLHGDLEQAERQRILALFRQQQISALIATDIAARGLDIPIVETVINFDMPRRGNDYIHRAGRTGRGSATGTVIALITAQEWNHSDSIRRYLDLTVDWLAIPGLIAQFDGSKKKRRRHKK